MDTSDSGNCTVLFNTNFDRLLMKFEGFYAQKVDVCSNYREDFDIETFEAHQRISQFSKFVPSYFLLP